MTVTFFLHHYTSPIYVRNDYHTRIDTEDPWVVLTLTSKDQPDVRIHLQTVDMDRIDHLINKLQRAKEYLEEASVTT